LAIIDIEDLNKSVLKVPYSQIEIDCELNVDDVDEKRKKKKKLISTFIVLIISDIMQSISNNYDEFLFFSK